MKIFCIFKFSSNIYWWLPWVREYAKVLWLDEKTGYLLLCPWVWQGVSKCKKKSIQYNVIYVVKYIKIPWGDEWFCWGWTDGGNIRRSLQMWRADSPGARGKQHKPEAGKGRLWLGKDFVMIYARESELHTLGICEVWES